MAEYGNNLETSLILNETKPIGFFKKIINRFKGAKGFNNEVMISTRNLISNIEENEIPEMETLVSEDCMRFLSNCEKDKEQLTIGKTSRQDTEIWKEVNLGLLKGREGQDWKTVTDNDKFKMIEAIESVNVENVLNVTREDRRNVNQRPFEEKEAEDSRET